MLNDLIRIATNNENWLLERLLQYAEKHNSTQSIPQTLELLRISIAGYTKSLQLAVQLYENIPELDPKSDYVSDPITSFGLLEAQQYRARGRHLSIYLGLLKYFRYSYIDLINSNISRNSPCEYFERFVHRFFDRIEIAVCTTWNDIKTDKTDPENRHSDIDGKNLKDWIPELFRDFSSPVLHFRLSGPLIGLNKQFCQIFLGKSDTIIKDVRILKEDRTLQGAINSLADILDGTKSENFFEIPMQTATGRRHFRIHKKILQSTESDSGDGILIFIDITDLKQKESEFLRLNLAMEQSLAIVVITSPNGNITYVNPRFSKITGYSLEESIGQNPRFLKSGNQSAQFYSNLWGTITSGKTWNGVFQNRKKSGDLYWEKAIISPVKNSDGKIINYIAIKEDVTVQRRAELKLKNSEMRFRKLMHQAPFAIEIYSTDGRLQEVNPAWEKVWENVDPDDVVGNFVIFDDPQIYQPYKEAFLAALKGSSIDLPEVELEMGELGNRFFHSRIFPIKDTKGEVLSLVLSYEEITDRILAERDLDRYHAKLEELVEQRTQELNEKHAQLIHADRLTSLGELAAGVAHELNQPLAIIRGEAELMSLMEFSDPNQSDEISGGTKNIIGEVDRAAVIIENMREYSVLNTEIQDNINLVDPIEKSLSLFNRQFQNRQIQLSFTHSDSLPLVKIHPQRFEQIIINFISNARHAVEQKTALEGVNDTKAIAIDLSYQPGDKSMILKISDDGIGMSEEVRKKCMEPFFTTRETSNGTGLGLSIVSDIIREFDGNLSIASQPGVGTTMTVSIPVP